MGGSDVRERSTPADAAFRACGIKNCRRHEEVIDAIITTLPPLTERQWARLAMLAADQAGLGLADQYRLRDALDQVLCP